MEKEIKKRTTENEKRILISLDNLELKNDSLELELGFENLEESLNGAGSARCVFVATKQPCLLPKVAEVKKSLLRQKMFLSNSDVQILRKSS